VLLTFPLFLSKAILLAELDTAWQYAELCKTCPDPFLYQPVPPSEVLESSSPNLHPPVCRPPAHPLLPLFINPWDS